MRALLQELRTAAAAYLVLAIGLVVTATVAMYVAGAIRAQQVAHFDEITHGAVEEIRDRMQAYVATLRATRGLFTNGREPSRGELGAFVASLELDRYYPGIQGIGYARLVPAAELAAHEAAVRAEGFPGYRVWPTEPARDPYTAIVALEPFDWRNQRAFGYDMASEPLRRAAMERARDTGQAASSARVELVQEAGSERQAGFLIYLPVYRGEAATPAERRARLAGWVYAPFRAGDLLRATLTGVPAGTVTVAVFDGPDVAKDELLVRTPGGAPPPSGALVSVQHIEVAGRPWTVRVEATGAFAPVFEGWLPRWVAMAGLLLSYLLFRLTRGEVHSRAAAQRAARRARFLAEAGQTLASSLEYRSTLAAVADRAAHDLADWCIVLVVEPEGPVRLFGHRDAEAAKQAQELAVGLLLDPEERFGAAAALARAEPFLAHELDQEALARIARTPAQLAALRDAGVRSLLTVPLRARGESFGAITLASCEPQRFDQDDLAMALDLARLAGAAIDTARLYRRAQDAVRLRDEFLSIASHELKTPLTSLALQSDSLMATVSRGGAAEALGRKAEVIRRNVDRLNRLIGNLLDISRIGAGRLELELEELDLCEVVREVTARFEDELARAGCELRLRLEGPARGRWDHLRLDQVITNLVANAVKYGPGRPITVAVAPRAEQVVLTVRDEGIGIPVDAQERIFERFERAVSERHYGGFGLGLWIVRRIVEALGGEIRVESVPGEGATFVVTLQRQDAAEAAPRGEPPAEPAQPRAW
jgi:signal transduction histidine kinase/CHASE1-domain containing sensor protein